MVWEVDKFYAHGSLERLQTPLVIDDRAIRIDLVCANGGLGAVRSTEVSVVIPPVIKEPWDYLI